MKTFHNPVQQSLVNLLVPENFSNCSMVSHAMDRIFEKELLKSEFKEKKIIKKAAELSAVFSFRYKN